MKIAIHQPEHFPYIGFFKKMHKADVFVILDDVQFVKGNWHNRNKFLNMNNVVEFMNVQVQPDSYKKQIKDVITANTDWRVKLLKKIKQNFDYDLESIYLPEKLVDINMNSIHWCMQYFNINVPIIKSSILNINSTGTQRIIDICTTLNADTYISGIGGKEYLDTTLFTNINLEFMDPVVPNYYSSLYNIHKGYTI
jgi:hypothetical protein